MVRLQHAAPLPRHPPCEVIDLKVPVKHANAQSCMHAYPLQLAGVGRCGLQNMYKGGSGEEQGVCGEGVVVTVLVLMLITHTEVAPRSL